MAWHLVLERRTAGVAAAHEDLPPVAFFSSPVSGSSARLFQLVFGCFSWFLSSVAAGLFLLLICHASSESQQDIQA